MILSTFVPPFYYCAIPGIMVASLSQTTIFGAHGCRRWHSSPENVMYLHKQNLCVCKINVAQNNGKRTQSTIRFGFYFAICRSVFIFSFFSVSLSLSRRCAPCTIHSVVCIFYVDANATAIVNHVPCLLSFWIQIVRALSIDVPEIISINKFVSVVCACVCCERNTQSGCEKDKGSYYIYAMELPVCLFFGGRMFAIIRSRLSVLCEKFVYLRSMHNV